MSVFLDKKLASLVPYTPGEQPRDIKNLLKLNTNESPYPPSPRVIEAISASEVFDLRLYSDPRCTRLVEAIAEYNSVEPSNVLPGNGSDEVLAFCFHGLCESGAVFPDISYDFYSVYSEMFGVRYTRIPLREDFTIAVKDYAGQRGTVFIANPNAPTGIALPLADIEALLLQDASRLVVIDEAYVDFGADSAAALLDRYANLLVVRTFSKSHSLAGARIGYAMGSSELIADLNTLKFSFNPYNLNRLSILAGAAAIADREYYAETRRKTIATREYTTDALREYGFAVLDSRTNFIFAGGNPKIHARDYFAKLRENGILVRYFPSPRIDNYVRISMGTMKDMRRLADVTGTILGGNGNA